MISAKKYILQGVILISSLCFIISGCDSSECEQSGLPMVRFDFFDLNRQELAPDSDHPLTVTAGDTDSVLINRSVSSYFRIPLNYTNDSTIFYLYFTSTPDAEDIVPDDTIIVYYNNKPFFISMECGTAVFQDIEHIEYTRNSFDSIAIINPDVTKDEKSHIHIFINTDE